MSIDVKLPELGEGIENGDVLDILVREGDQISKDQGILEIETDKATVEVPSSHAGKVVQIHVSPGDRITVGAKLVTLEETASTAAASAQPSAPGPASSAKQQAAPSQDESARPSSEPIQPTTEADHASGGDEQAVIPGDQRRTNTADTLRPPRSSGTPTPTPGPAADVTPSPSPSTVIKAGPSVRRFAREVGVDLRRVSGSGPEGRIVRDDVLKFIRQASRQSSGVGAAADDATSRDRWGPIQVERMPRIRQVIAEQMRVSWTSVPRVTNFDDADVTELEKLRQASKADYAQQGIKLTAMPFIIKSVALALKGHPIVNAALDLENNQVIYKNYVNVGIAVDADRGLVVPSLRGADRLSIPDIARQLASLAERIRSGNFTPDDLAGSTFTISNLGAIGGTYSTPIINFPEVAILLVGRTRKLPVVVDDQVQVRLMMPLSLSYDHRLVDGAAAARFLNEVIGYLNAPSRLLLAP